MSATDREGDAITYSAVSDVSAVAINVSTGSSTSNSLNFDGTDDYLNLGNVGNLSDGSVQFLYK